jgi:hypothetical protein
VTGPVKVPTFWWADLMAMWEERDRQRHAAYHDTSHAEALLLSLLPSSERERYGATKEFLCTGSDGGMYLIRHGVTGNVVMMPSGQQLCAHIPIYRDADIELSMVAQLLAISTAEHDFLAVANRF